MRASLFPVRWVQLLGVPVQTKRVRQTFLLIGLVSIPRKPSSLTNLPASPLLPPFPKEGISEGRLPALLPGLSVW